MFGFKDAYFYLIALQITFIKFLKKIYFSTNYYNKSLQTKAPVQVSFNPNPFLLSIISPYNKKSFKINDVSPNEFWLEKKDKNFREHHSFLWLNLIDRKSNSKSIQKIIYLWMQKYSNFKRRVWESSILSSRIISWILNIDIIINNGTFDYKKNVFLNIISQCNHLKINVRFEKNQLKKVEILAALILSGLVFKEYKDNFTFGIRELEKFTKYYFDKDGFPMSRNPSDLVFVTKYFLLCRESIKDAQEYLPEFLEDIIEKNLTCIKIIKTPDDKSPLFNGGYEYDLKRFEKYFDGLSSKKQDTVGGIFQAKIRNQIFFLDIGDPPIKNFSKNYQSGPLSFEYYSDGLKIITNCGFGVNISSKAELISRLTASQSTLTINETSITKFERNKLVNRIFGNSIKSAFKTSELQKKNDDNFIGCSILHNGYERNFKCFHKREIYLDKINNKLIGLDHILKKSDGKPIKYVFRFHLNPELTAIKTMGGNSALIQISKNKSLIFSVKNEGLEIEKSIYLGRNKILDNSCITISGNLVNKDKSFAWEIKKKI
tara:strand:+ start:993 stop:2627 length:1635 start_codon:yes stop_codon:yes gene_type:complete